MTHRTSDLSLFFKVIHGKLADITGAYVEDTIGAGTNSFEMESRLTEQRSQSTARGYDSTTFAGIEVNCTDY